MEGERGQAPFAGTARDEPSVGARLRTNGACPLSPTGLDISLSYGAGEGWIGLIRGGWIGVDVAGAAPLAEAEDVARLYLGPAATAEIRAAVEPAGTGRRLDQSGRRG